MTSSTQVNTSDAIPDSRRLRNLGLVEKLRKAEVFHNYQAAFRKATGLPLAIRPVGVRENGLAGNIGENEFCKLMRETQEGCARCLDTQADLVKSAENEPRTVHCASGLSDSVVPIRVGEQLIGFLQTGQVLLHQPNESEFSRTTKQILKWGAEVDVQELREAYFKTQVLDEKQYEGMILLLASFAHHLTAICNAMALEGEEQEPALVANAKSFLERKFRDQVTLGDAAKAVNASTRHFCKVFKQTTGMTFTDYLSRLRIEKSKALLDNRNFLISEIAFEVGFESISQFNRSFKRIVGCSPSEFRGRL